MAGELTLGTGDTRGPAATPRPGPATRVTGAETEETNLPDCGTRLPGPDTTLAPEARPELETGLVMTLPVKPVTGVRGSEACAPPTTLLETRRPELETTPPGPVKALEMPLLLNA